MKKRISCIIYTEDEFEKLKRKYRGKGFITIRPEYFLYKDTHFGLALKKKHVLKLKKYLERKNKENKEKS